MTAMLTAYLDESYNQPTPKDPNPHLVHTVGCWLSTIEKWSRFGKQWKAELRNKGLDHFHMNRFENRIGEYEGWTDDERHTFFRRLKRIIKENTVYGATATVAALVIAANRELNFHSKWFYSAMGLMALAVALTTIARLYGTIDVLDPSKLNTDKWLKCTEWEFKNLVIQAGALAFTNNKRLIDIKWALALFVIVTFSLGAVCLAVWVVRMTTNA